MYIVPMSGINPLSDMFSAEEVNQKSDASFADIFKQALQNVEDTNKICQQDSVKVSLGEVDDLHTVQINMTKAATALEVFVAMKNTAVDAYNQVMSMSI